MKKKSLIFACIFTVIDQLIKYIIDSSFILGENHYIINNFFYLTKTYNKGAAWSFLSGKVLLLIVISLLAFIFILNYQNEFKINKRNTITFSLIYGGLFGNLIDRIIHGYVIDYIGFIFGSYHYPIFNFADICLVIGFILLIYAVLKKEDKNENSK